ncbi:carboxypeptidase-like regulatory domain-containing protein [Changchengzhania lutea]|uniref:carboxypeptidase-like regulatory domain-containing protein n=1 Tax=Changchengzhania lutea TaxID=2049305 RepID=UPI00115F3F85|nr:carboxypeptidase-like regulatory domain-containing protein [Changchengzhania lutea]
MKQILFILAVLASAFSFAQQQHSINGRLLDLESDNSVLVYAKVVIEETGDETLSDDKGFFQFENLKAGTYNLICSFVGYESKTLQVTLASNKTAHIEQFLGASTLSLDDLMLTMASADKSENPVSSNN